MTGPAAPEETAPAPTSPAPTAPTAPTAPAAKPKLTVEVDGKQVPAVLVEKNEDGSGGTLVPAIKYDTACKRCDHGYLRHGDLIPSPWCTEEGKAKHAALRG